MTATATQRILGELFDDLFRNHVVPQWRREAEALLRLVEATESGPPPNVPMWWACKCVGGGDYRGVRCHWWYATECPDCGTRRP